jgi:putative tryptophan/tyrosine transport system substrate-binding protein
MPEAAMGVRRRSRRRLLHGAVALTGLGLLAGCGWPLVSGQQGARVHRVGFLAVGSRAGRAPLIEAFVQGLNELGYIEGQNLVIEYRFSDGNDARLPDLAAELVSLNVDVILASGTLAAVAAQQATGTIPIVMGSSAAPVGTGLVTSIARPGANVTGVSLLSPETAGKRLELFKETIPGLSRLAVLTNETSPAHVILEREIEAAAPALGITTHILHVRSAQDLADALGAAQSAGDHAVYPASDPLFTNTRVQLAELALRHRLPLMSDFRENVEAGALLAYGPVFATMYRRAASFVDRILKGAKPADLPVEQPTNFDLFVNTTTANALGLTIPQSVLRQAAEVIQ